MTMCGTWWNKNNNEQKALRYQLTPISETGFGFRVIGVRVLVFFIRLGELILVPVKWPRPRRDTGKYHKIWL